MSALGGFRSRPGCRVDILPRSPLSQVYGIFYATSFLDLYQNPQSVTTSLHDTTVLVGGDEQYLFLVSLPGWRGLCCEGAALCLGSWLSAQGRGAGEPGRTSRDPVSRRQSPSCAWPPGFPAHTADGFGHLQPWRSCHGGLRAPCSGGTQDLQAEHASCGPGTRDRAEQ